MSFCSQAHFNFSSCIYDLVGNNDVVFMKTTDKPERLHMRGYIMSVPNFQTNIMYNTFNTYIYVKVHSERGICELKISLIMAKPMSKLKQ